MTCCLSGVEQRVTHLDHLVHALGAKARAHRIRDTLGGNDVCCAHVAGLAALSLRALGHFPVSRREKIGSSEGAGAYTQRVKLGERYESNDLSELLN